MGTWGTDVTNYTRTLDDAGRKQCRTCKKWVPLNDYHADKRMAFGRMADCPSCISKRRAGKHGTRARKPEWGSAHNALYFAVKRGEIVRPDKCQVCDKESPRIEGHHYKGYDRPLDVQWLCRRCHSAAHSQAARSLRTGGLMA